MAELATWSELGRWMWILSQRLIPNRILRLVWKKEEVLAAIQFSHFDSAPCFLIFEDRPNSELSVAGFNLFNLTPFNFDIVGIDLRVTINSVEFLKCQKRFPTSTRVAPYSRSGFYYDESLSGSQVDALHRHTEQAVRIRTTGAVILDSVFGELRKDVDAAVLAEINK